MYALKKVAPKVKSKSIKKPRKVVGKVVRTIPYEEINKAELSQPHTIQLGNIFRSVKFYDNPIACGSCLMRGNSNLGVVNTETKVFKTFKKYIEEYLEGRNFGCFAILGDAEFDYAGSTNEEVLFALGFIKIHSYSNHNYYVGYKQHLYFKECPGDEYNRNHPDDDNDEYNGDDDDY